MTDIERKIAQILIQKLGIDKQKITPNANIINDLGADSLDQIEIIMGFEDIFKIEIPDKDLANLKNVQNIYDYIQKRVLN